MVITIRKAIPEDAEKMLKHVNLLSEEPNICIPLSPGEFKLTIEEEMSAIADISISDNSVFMLAFDNEQLVGVSNVCGGKRNAMRHASDLGISIHKDYRGMGIGRKLMESVILWARETSILKRIELCVYERNAAAIRLYEKLGFLIEGKKRKAIFQNGQYEDELIMALML